MRMRLALASVIALAVSLLAAPTALAEGSGTITGQVVDRTAGAAAVGTLEVRLHTMKDGAASTVAPVVVRTDADGRFTFTGVATEATTAYIVTAGFRDVEYASDVVAFKSGETSRAIEIPVYETTDRADAIAMRQQHLIVSPDAENGVLKVVEIAIVENTGDRTFVGTKSGDAAETVRLLLPPGAFDLELVRLLSTRGALIPGGVAYTGPLAPGQTELVLGYSLDFVGSAVVIEKAFELATGAVDVLVADTGLAARSAQLRGPESVEVGGNSYLRLTGRQLAAGSVVRLEIAVAQAPSALADLGSLAPVGLLAVVVGMTAYLLVAPRLRRRAVPASGPRRPARARRAAIEPDDALPEEDVE